MNVTFEARMPAEMRAPDGITYPIRDVRWQVFVMDSSLPPDQIWGWPQTAKMELGQTATATLTPRDTHWGVAVWVTFEMPTGPRPWLYQWEGDYSFEDGVAYVIDGINGTPTPAEEWIPTPGVPVSVLLLTAVVVGAVVLASKKQAR